MDTNALKKFAQAARNLLIDQVRSKLDLVLDPASPARREHPQAMKELDAAISRDGKAQVIEQVAYTWFNRFTALRFMDTNGYTTVGVVSPAEGQTRPELLAEAMAGNLPEGSPGSIAALLDGRTPSSDPQAEAYRQLLVHACNQWHGPMPFLFEELDDYTELLMPEDLLSQSSILAELRKVMTEDACQDVEIIGWLYQFYISEKKDQVFAGLKKNQKITAENIPAATQLFTPHWIVRYLVENSLGRLWLLNRPGSKLAERMDYYIAPEEPETDFLKITKPEDIRICDPAAGSGHMLTYAFDLLYAIYEEEGYEATVIPALILEHNLTGVEIDDRAGALAAFALAMKAAARLGRRRFLRMEAKPDICVLQNVAFSEAEMQDIAAMVGKDLFTDELRETLGQFEQAKNFGSLIVPKLRDPAETLRVVEARDFGGDLLLKEVQERVIAVLRMAEALSPKYHVVVANPPYMGGKGMNGGIASFLKTEFSDVRHDLFSAFMVRNTYLALPKAQLGFMTPFVWMFLSSYELLRSYLLDHKTLTSLIQLEYSGFDGATVPICTFTMENFHRPDFLGGYVKLSEFRGASQQGPRALEAIKDPSLSWFHRATARQFEKIPGYPISFWVSDVFRDTFKYQPLSQRATVPSGIVTGNTEFFIRQWSEVGFDTVNKAPQLKNFVEAKWVPYLKGSDGRKWYGNLSDVLNWKNEGSDLFRSRSTYSEFYFRPCLTFSRITSGDFSARFAPEGFLWDVNGPSIHAKSEKDQNMILGLLCSKAVDAVLDALAPTISKNAENLYSIPIPPSLDENDFEWVGRAIKISHADWDSSEISLGFSRSPLLMERHGKIDHAVQNHIAEWQRQSETLREIEEFNNQVCLNAYGMEHEVDASVPIEKVVMFNNPSYRVQGENFAAFDRLILQDFLSYAVGCMFGRYSLDASGLILANQGERLEDYLARIPEPSFMPDEDNVIPVLDENWFPDDITERFRLFLRVTFGEAHFRENLRYIEDALGKDIRKYFTKDFYADHVKRYKKRPIYWMFSSPKGTFNALIYMHRYRPDTVSVLLNDYLREFISKLEGERGRLEKLSDDPSASQGQRTKALKDMAVIAKQIDELNEWERDVVFPLAQAKIEIDLDDGVKANYPKFGEALKRIPGLEAKDD